MQAGLIDLLFRQSRAILLANFVIPWPVAYVLREAVPGTSYAVETRAGIELEPEFMERYPVPDAARRDHVDVLLDKGAWKILARHEELGPQEFWDLAEDATGDRLTITWSSSTTLLEISAAQVTKASTLAMVCADLGIGPDEVIAFGDMPNDIPMLSWAGRSWAMADAHPTVVEVADEVAPDPRWLDALEAQLAEHGAALAANRRQLVERLDAALLAQDDTHFPRPTLALEPVGPEERDALLRALRDNRGADRRAGRTLIGPHRAELAVTLASKGVAAAHSSTGEQKAMLIAIVLAHGSLAAKDRAGVLLLDEVAAHLDPDRRAALFERIEANGEQVWMTGTERAPFDAILARAAVWDVSGGTLRRI